MQHELEKYFVVEYGGFKTWKRNDRRLCRYFEYEEVQDKEMEYYNWRKQ